MPGVFGLSNFPGVPDLPVIMKIRDIQRPSKYFFNCLTLSCGLKIHLRILKHTAKAFFTACNHSLAVKNQLGAVEQVIIIKVCCRTKLCIPNNLKTTMSLCNGNHLRQPNREHIFSRVVTLNTTDIWTHGNRKYSKAYVLYPLRRMAKITAVESWCLNVYRCLSVLYWRTARPTC